LDVLPEVADAQKAINDKYNTTTRDSTIAEDDAAQKKNKNKRKKLVKIVNETKESIIS